MRNLLTAERILQGVTICLSVFLIFYLVTYVQDARERSDCQTAVNTALIEYVRAAREANSIEAQAMDNLLNSLLNPDDTQTGRESLEKYQDQRSEAQRLRVNNPLPDPAC